MKQVAMGGQVDAGQDHSLYTPASRNARALKLYFGALIITRRLFPC